MVKMYLLSNFYLSNNGETQQNAICRKYKQIIVYLPYHNYIPYFKSGVKYTLVKPCWIRCVQQTARTFPTLILNGYINSAVQMPQCTSTKLQNCKNVIYNTTSINTFL